MAPNETSGPGGESADSAGKSAALGGASITMVGSELHVDGDGPARGGGHGADGKSGTPGASSAPAGIPAAERESKLSDSERVGHDARGASSASTSRQIDAAGPLAGAGRFASCVESQHWYYRRAELLAAGVGGGPGSLWPSSEA